MEKVYISLTKEIKNHDVIVLVAHKNIDLDAFGSLLGLYEIIKDFGKTPKIFMNKKVNESVKKAMLKTDDIDYLFNIKSAKEDDLLIIVDTHKEEIIENKDLLHKIKDIIILDHHIKDANYIKNTKISFIDSNASSTVEIIVGYMRYLNKKVSNIIASIMLAGIEIDTNRFDIKTTDTTYETAAFLYKLGVDNVFKKELLQQNKEEYLKRQAMLKKARMINNAMALCVLDDDIHSKEDLSIIAMDLLQFDNVEAGFAIGFIAKNTVGISAKSVSDINVEITMKKLGGGGHANNAATQLENKNLKDAEQLLLSTLKEDL